jgi:hypothetical protein
MTALIIGGDNLGNIPGKLSKKGYDTIEHIDGRKGWDRRAGIPHRVEKADLVIVFVDYLSHSIARSTKEKLRSLNANAIYTKRSWAHLENQFKKIEIS